MNFGKSFLFLFSLFTLCQYFVELLIWFSHSDDRNKTKYLINLRRVLYIKSTIPTRILLNLSLDMTNEYLDTRHLLLHFISSISCMTRTRTFTCTKLFWVLYQLHKLQLLCERNATCTIYS